MGLLMPLVQVRRGVDLVYGGGSIGLMGLVARTVLDGGRRVVGYVPPYTTLPLLLAECSALPV
jgi:hypothetical protein